MIELLVLNGSRAGACFSLPAVPTVLGRSPEAHLRVDDPWISNLHALFEQRGDELWVVDLGSRNGTFLHGVHVAEARLAIGDLVSFGQTRIRVDPPGASQGPAEQATRTPIHTVAVNATLRTTRPPAAAPASSAPPPAATTSTAPSLAAPAEPAEPAAAPRDLDGPDPTR